MADAGLLIDWRNEPDTLAVSGNTRPVSQEEHEGWLSGLLEDHDRLLLIASLDDTPVGQIRFEPRGGAYEVSVSIDTESRGRGLGSRLISAGVDWLAQHHPGETVRATVSQDNARSVAAFERAGFARTGEADADGWLTLERTADL